MICHRCRIKSSEFICKECNSSLCSECDNFVHSSLKRPHKREKVNSHKKANSIVSDLNTNYETNLNFYPNRIIDQNNENNKENGINESIKYYNDSNIYNYDSYSLNKINFSNRTPERIFYSIDNDALNKQFMSRTLYDINHNYNNNNNNNNDINTENNIVSYRSKSNSHNNSYIKNNTQIMTNISSRYINQIKEIYEQEKKGLILKVNKLTQELDDTKKNLTERIEYLHKYLYEVENKHKKELNESKYNNRLETKRLEDEKNIKIDKLQNIINSQNDIINNLKLKINQLETTMSDKESAYLKKDRDISHMNNEKEDIENYYKNEIEQLKKKHTEEKASLISEYEYVIKQVSSELDVNKNNYLKALEEIKEKEKMMKSMADRLENEKDEINQNFMKLEQQNIKDKKNLMKLNYDLKSESENKSEIIEKLKTEIQNLSQENVKMKSKVKKMKKQNSEMKSTNIKLNDAMKDKVSKK